MPNLPEGFPTDCSDEKIIEVINEFSSQLRASNASINASMNYSPVIQLGQNELQRRFVNRTSDTSSRLTKISIIIASLSILLSFVAIICAVASIRSSHRWEDRQIKLLEKIIKVWN